MSTDRGIRRQYDGRWRQLVPAAVLFACEQNRSSRQDPSPAPVPHPSAVQGNNVRNRPSYTCLASSQRRSVPRSLEVQCAATFSTIARDNPRLAWPTSRWTVAGMFASLPRDFRERTRLRKDTEDCLLKHRQCHQRLGQGPFPWCDTRYRQGDWVQHTVSGNSGWNEPCIPEKFLL